MKEIDNVIRKMNLDFFGTGSHRIVFDQLMDLIKKDDVFLLDVRTKEELQYVVIPFANNIPLHEIPDNLDRLPKNKLIAVYCTSCIRAAIAYSYLLSRGYNVKVILSHLDEFVANFKPGYVRKNLLK